MRNLDRIQAPNSRFKGHKNLVSICIDHWHSIHCLFFDRVVSTVMERHYSQIKRRVSKELMYRVYNEICFNSIERAFTPKTCRGFVVKQGVSERLFA